VWSPVTNFVNWDESFFSASRTDSSDKVFYRAVVIHPDR
jgi:hypothetical protein